MDQEVHGIRSVGADIPLLWRGADAVEPAFMRAAGDPLRDPGPLRDGFAWAQLQLLDRINLAAAVLSREERIVAVNGRCERVLGGSLARQGGRLVARDRLSNERLRNAIRGVFSSQGRSPADASRGVIVREPESPILFKALPLAPSPFDGRSGYALLIFSSPELQSVPDASLLARAFGMTPAQARLAHYLATGASLNAAAALLGVKKETVRNHLKQIFLRTGTRRQGELVALLSAFWLATQEDGEDAAERCTCSRNA